MAQRTAKPAAKKPAVTKVAGKPVGKPKTLKAAVTASPKKAAPAKKKTAVIAKPKSPVTPAAKKAVAPAAASKPPAKKAVATKTKPVQRKAAAKISPEERYRMVQTAAYFIAERNGFGGCSTDHWAAAEVEIASILGE